MRLRTWALAAAATTLGILLVVLGALQLRWLDQVARTLTAEKRASLHRRGSALATDLEREVARLFFWFQLEEVEVGASEARQQLLAERWDSFRRVGRHVPLVAELWLAERGPDQEGPTLQRLDLTSGTLVPAGWPAGTEAFQRQLNEGFLAFGLVRTDPAFSGALLAIPAERRPGPPRPGRPLVLVRLDRAYLTDRLLPALAEQHLSAAQGEAAVMEVKDESGRRLFAWPAGMDTIRPDEHDPILVSGIRLEHGSTTLLTGMRPTRRSPEDGFGPDRRGGPRGPGGFGGERRTGGLGGPGGPGGPRGSRELRGPPGGPLPSRPAMWRLSLGYAAGPVDALVTNLRRRNLALGFSILGLLGGAIGALAVAVRRAHTLAERQRQFMASVSHELRTPLAVIGAAAENLRDGTVEDGDRVREYGDMIHAESKRLTAMVDDVLRLAAGQDLRANLHLERMDVRDVVETAIDSFQQDLRARGGSLHTVLADDGQGAPLVLADAEALRQAVENVVGNAIKYGGDPPSVTVRISRQQAPGGAEVLIAVEDRGLGIPTDEQRLVFEPFFRGRDPMTRQIRGTGLGLALVQRVMEAHGGRVSLDSTPGQGSRFTLHLPSPASEPGGPGGPAA